MTAHDELLALLADPMADSTAVHACEQADCPLNGVTLADVRHIATAMTVWDAHRDDIRLLTFRDDNGPQLLLAVDWDGRHAVIGALYTPGLLDDLRNRPYTVRPWDETDNAN